MTKKGFTLMELLVSIFITGMVMLSLVAMWRTSSNHTAQAQRQSIIRNESTIFLRKIYSDFVFASESICPWIYATGTTNCNGAFIAVKNAVINPDDTTQLVRITSNVCGASHDQWATNEDTAAISSRCIKPSYTIYVHDSTNHIVYRCHDTFLDGEDSTMSITSLINTARSHCNTTSNRETVLPYVESFSFAPASAGSSPELSINYTVKREFGGTDVPPVYFKFDHLLTIKRGV